MDGKTVENWRMVLISTTKDAIIGDADYQTALRNAEKYALDRNQTSILVRGLSLTNWLMRLSFLRRIYTVW